MSTVHSVRTDEGTVAVDIDCAYCGYAGTAAVRARGSGSATSFVFFDRNSARRRAVDEALEDQAHQARVTAGLLPCPRCRRRSRAAVIGYVIGTVIGTVALVALAAAVWWLTDRGLEHWLGTGALLFGAVALAASKRKRLRDAEAQLVGVKLRAAIPQAAVVKVGPAVVPVASKAPERTAANTDKPRLLG